MNMFCYFVEPASYTLDLAENIYKKNKIDYCFINSNTLAKSLSTSEKVFLDRLSIFSKLYFLISTFNRNDFIIVNGYNSYVFFVTFMLNLFSFNKKYIAIESDTQLSVPRNIIKRIVKRFYLSTIFRSKYILGFAGGGTVHKDLFRHYGMQEERIFLMPMMVDNQKYYSEPKIFPKVFSFLFVGRLIETKNVEKLCERFLYHFSDKNVNLTIVGDGEDLDRLKTEYSHPNISFRGSVFNEDLVRLYRNSSVFVFPSSLDAWGLVINEALSASLPVVVHKAVGAAHDLIKNRSTGMIASDMKMFGEMMLELYNNSDLLMKFSKNALNLMRGYWNYELYDKCLSAVIKKLENDL